MGPFNSKGLLLSYLLAPGTGNLRFKEVVNRVLQENWEEHKKAKEKSRSSLNRSLHQQAMLLEELDELSKKLQAAKDKKVQKDVDERMGVVRTALNKAEASITRNKACLEESQIQEEEACQEHQGQSDSSEEQEDNIVVERPEESAPTSVESTNTLRNQEAEPSMEVDLDDILPLAPDSATMVTPEEDEMLMGVPPQWLERWPSYRSPPLTALSLRTVKPNSRSLLNVLVRHSP